MLCNSAACASGEDAGQSVDRQCIECREVSIPLIGMVKGVSK